MHPVPRTRLPVLALRTKVVFPRAVTTVDIERSENLRALELHPREDELFLVVPLHDRHGSTNPESMCPVGTVARVVDRMRLPTGFVRVVLQGLRRLPVDELVLEDGCYTAAMREEDEHRDEPEQGPTGLEKSVKRTLDLVRAVTAHSDDYDEDLTDMLALNAGAPSQLADLVASSVHLGYEERARLLCEADTGRRLELLIELLRHELVRSRISESVSDEVQERIRRGYLRQQLKVIRAELGDADPREVEAGELERRMALVNLSRAARRKAERTLAQFRRVAVSSPESARLRKQLEWMLDLPWPAREELPDELVDIESGRDGFAHVVKALDRSHHSLSDVKQRVVEYLAVRQLRGGARGTVLCFLGPPGTGKSSMARAVAEALGREFVRIPVGSLTDECELRGEPAEQDGTAPGLVLQALARAGTCNPVLLIDEIDKLQLGGSGAAAGPLLEILDPEQNAEFHDVYLGVPYDLSRCIFLATANDVVDLPEALLDRLEVIEFSGYTESEKLAIVRTHLLPRARDRAGIEPWELRLTPAALRAIVRNYTEEAGVRSLQRQLDSLARKAAVEVIRRGRGLYVRKSSLLGLLGPAIADDDLHLGRPAVGISIGLAWTSAGGSLLPVEALLMPGAGRTILTGQLGDVLRESVQAAISYVRSRFGDLGLGGVRLEEIDLHLHFPSAGTPKDGPSAGVAIATALVSLLSKAPVRHDVAMTGELSLHGDVLPVGGIRDKLLAAVRAGVPEVIVPLRNSEEVLRLPPEIRSKLTVHLIEHVDEAFGLALVGKKRKAAPGRGGRRSARGA